jgi:hypothetical protein
MLVVKNDLLNVYNFSEIPFLSPETTNNSNIKLKLNNTTLLECNSQSFLWQNLCSKSAQYPATFVSFLFPIQDLESSGTGDFRSLPKTGVACWAWREKEEVWKGRFCFVCFYNSDVLSYWARRSIPCFNHSSLLIYNTLPFSVSSE